MIDSLFIFQQGLQEQKMTMKTGKKAAWGLIAIATMVVAQPAFANNKERSKRTDAQSENNESCKTAVRSMSESTPQRKNECQKTRRILM